jgi:hypothetical protein
MLTVLGFCIINPEDTVSDVRRNAGTPVRSGCAKIRKSAVA